MCPLSPLVSCILFQSVVGFYCQELVHWLHPFAVFGFDFLLFQYFDQQNLFSLVNLKLFLLCLGGYQS